MCGIVGYVGSEEAQNFLLEGLRRLEYRGYDSAGVATSDLQQGLSLVKTAGRVDALAECMRATATPGKVGIGHTRWATHGPATDQNAHPHFGGDGQVVVVHNGVIENYQLLRNQLQEAGYAFESATDTEVVAHLIAQALEEISTDHPADPHDPATSRFAKALQRALTKLKGTYGLAVLFRDCPDALFAARLGSPLVVGVGEDAHYLASDVSPLVGHTDRIVYLDDHELAILSPDQLRVINREQHAIKPSVQFIKSVQDDVDLGDYSHYMLKEIMEQPKSLQDSMRGRLDTDAASAHFGGLNLLPRQLREVDRIVMTACGTSWHAALVGEYLFEEIAGIPVEVEYASELRYRNPPLDRNTLLFAITQSGETADTLAALREIKRKGHHTLAICNVVGSTIAREADGGVYLHAGQEIGVASTKAFTSQCAVLLMLALHFGRLRTLSYNDGNKIIHALRQLPQQVSLALQSNQAVQRLAVKYADCRNFLYLGRQYNFPAALEGALKLKEISYIHAEGYPAAEMKHGPIALVDEDTPSVFIVPRGLVYDKVLANMEEIRARGGPIIAIAETGDTQVAEIADDVIYVPAVEEYLQPIIASIPLQLLAYHVALLRGCDVDKPRNLAKSVTVE